VAIPYFKISYYIKHLCLIQHNPLQDLPQSRRSISATPADKLEFP